MDGNRRDFRLREGGGEFASSVDSKLFHLFQYDKCIIVRIPYRVLRCIRLFYDS